MKEDALAIQVERRIYFIRREKVMLDYDLAVLYGIETRALKQVVRRNSDRFSPDFIGRYVGITNCDTRLRQVWSRCANGFHRTRRRHALQCPKK